MNINNPPPSNLGPYAEPWARYITEQTQANQTAIERLGGDFSTDGSLNNAALENISYQINELRQRQAGTVRAPDFNTAAFANPTMLTNVVNIQIPRPSQPRMGTVSVQFTATNSNFAQSEVYASMEIDGTTFHRDSRSVPTQNLEPASWGGQKAIIGFTGFTAGPGFGGSIRLTLQVEAIYDGATTPRIVSYKNIQANYQYGQAI